MGDIKTRWKLDPDTSEQAYQAHAKLKSVHDFLQETADALTESDALTNVVKALERAVPWAGQVVEAIGDSLPPAKFLLSLLEGVGRIDDPHDLGLLASTLAFQTAVQQALPEVIGMAPPRARTTRRALSEQVSGDYDFSEFSWGRALTHPFVTDATRSLEELGNALGLEGHWNVQLQREVHARFTPALRALLCHRDTEERFAPFRRLIETGSETMSLSRAISDHVETQRWMFEDRAVLGTEPFSLANVYVEPEATHLTWQELQGVRDRRGQDPFDHRHPRVSLLDTVVALLGDQNYRDAIFVQGPAGSGKSTFTLRLCSALLRAGMTPLRVELKHLDARPGVHLADALARSLEFRTQRPADLPAFLPQGVDYTRQFLALFDEQITFKATSVCPYVLVLDGWDELPLTGDRHYLERLRGLLRDLDELFLLRRPTSFPIRVLLAGRPSDFLAQAGLLRPTTRVITLQPWQDSSLGEFIKRIATAHARSDELNRKLKLAPGTHWRLPAEPLLEELVSRFRVESLHVHRPQSEAVLGVLGSPLIAHLCLRLLGEGSHAGGVGSTVQLDDLLGDGTVLYRRLVDLVVKKAGKSPDAAFDPTRSAMISGNDLRELLHRTAEVMTVLGVENVARDELALRLDLTQSQIEDRLRRLEGEELISRLMISFFFKGGHDALGCEFSHKSFREYLFAEGVVEALKRYARRLEGKSPPERSDQENWRDFRRNDPRWELSRLLGGALGTQWLTPEVKAHVRHLIAWEIGRSDESSHDSGPGLMTDPCSRSEWECVRDGLADLWDWWAEGAHLRPQPERIPQSREHEWTWPFAADLARGARFRAVSDIRAPIISTTVVDAHLGDALCELTALVHAHLLGVPTRATARRYQAQTLEGLRFAPSGPHRGHFSLFARRIGSASGRSVGLFPTDTYLGRVGFANVDLSDSHLDFAVLEAADLTGANLSSASLSNTDLTGATLTAADLSGAYLFRAKLNRADLTAANLCLSELREARLVAAILRRVDFREARLLDADLTDADCQDAIISPEQLESTRGPDLASTAPRVSQPADSFPASSTMELLLNQSDPDAL